MISNPEFGIDLPVKVLVYSKKDGTTFVSYNRPSALSSKHSTLKEHPSIVKMTKVLNLLKQAISK